VIDYSKDALKEKMKSFFDFDSELVKIKLGVRENKTWGIRSAQSNNQYNADLITRVNYRPFDVRYIYFASGFIERSRLDVMSHFIAGENIGLVFKLGNAEENSSSVHVTSNIIDFRSWSRPGMQGGDYVAPLYLYPGDGTERISNLNADEVKLFIEKLSLPFMAEKQDDESSFSPIDILDYIYAVLHSSNYRDKYKEFLKIDFPRIPYPNIETFWQLVTIGKQIRELHLMESGLLDELITAYPQAGDNIVTRKLTKTSIGYEATNDKQGRVWINDEQYFDNVPLIAWEFYIGGYQPAQKWLKDRRGRELSFEDVLHYQKIIKVLFETNRLVQAVDSIVKIYKKGRKRGGTSQK
jgi:predicted helicase